MSLTFSQHQRAIPVIILVILLLFSLAAMPNAVANRAEAASSAPTSFSIGEVATPPIAALNPLNPSSNSHIPTLLYDFLFSVNFPPLPFITPRMAEGYSVNANNTQWTITLRPNLKWSNGSPLNATDLLYTLWVYNASGFFSTPPVTNFSIVNSTAVNVTTQPGNFIFYDLIFNGFGILPSQTFSKVAPLYGNATNIQSFQNLNNVVSDGAFYIENYTQGQNPIVFQRNPYYWQGVPTFQTMNYYLYSTLSSELNAYESGQVGMYSGGGPYTNYQPVANLSGHSLVGPPQAIPGHTFGILFNDWTYPFNNTLVRRALAYGTNVTEINDRMNGPFSNSSLENQDLLLPAYNQAIGLNATGPHGYSYNVATAKQLFQQAGFKYSGSTLQYPNGTAVSFDVRFNAVHPWAQSTATLISQQWTLLGIKVNVIPTPTSTENNFAAQPNPTGWQVLAEEVTPDYLNNWGVTPGPGIVQELGTYEVQVNGTFTFWNQTYAQTYARLQNDPVNSSQYFADARACAMMNALDVPVVPLYNVFGMLAITNSISWGNPANYTGIYNTQAETGPEFWDETLYMAAPAAGSTTTGTSSSASSPINTTGVTSSVSSTATGTVTTASSSQAISSTSAASPPTSTSATGSKPAALNLAYVAAAIAVIIIVIAGAFIAMRRRRPPGAPPTAAATTTPTTT